jgi:nucleoside-diphosphate-sugar epimerase
VDSLSGENILVTGATGFIGKNLVDVLLRHGAHIHVMVRDVSKARKLLPHHGIHFIPGDLVNPRSWHEAINADTIFHLAGYAHAISDLDNRSSDVHKNITVDGTQHLLNAAVRAGVKRFIFASSVKAMSEETGSLCLDESSPAKPGSVYGHAKLKAEELVLAMGEKHGMHVCNLRLAMVFGPHNKGNLPRMIAAIDQGRFPPLPEVNNKRSMVHVNDVIQGMLLAAENPAACGKTYILTDGHIYSTRQIYISICTALGRRIPRWTLPVGMLNIAAKLGDIAGRIQGGRSALDSETLRKLIGSACYSSGKITKELGYCPTRTLQDALPEMIAAYKASE